MSNGETKSSFDDGNWVPIDKRVVNLLPRDKSYTYIEALISLTVDINNGKENSINGYAKLWVWSRNKTRRFVKGLRTGKGHIVDKKGTSKGHEIRLIDKELLIVVEDRLRTDEGQIEDKKKDTTIKTNTKTNINTKTNTKRKDKKNILNHNMTPKQLEESFEKFWKIYPRKVKKTYALEVFTKINPNEELFKKMIKAVEIMKDDTEWLRDEGRYIPHPSTWLNNKRWLDCEGYEEDKAEDMLDIIRRG